MNGWKLVPVEPDQIHQMAFEEGQPAENGDGYLFTAEEFDLFVDRLLTSAAAPVPPAGGEPGAVEGLRQLVIGPYPDPDVEDAHDEYLDEHQSQALWLLRNAGRIEAHVTRLTAENARLQAENESYKQGFWGRMAARNQIELRKAESELTKARELNEHLSIALSELDSTLRVVAVAGSKTALPSLRTLAKRSLNIAHGLLSEQSAPAAKGGE